MAGTACTELRRNGRSFHSQAIPENGRSFHSQAVPETPCVARWAVQHKVPTSRASWQVQLVPDLVRGKVGCAGPQGHRKPLRTKSQAQCIHGYVRIRAVPETQCVARWAVQAPRCTMGASGPKVRLAETLQMVPAHLTSRDRLQHVPWAEAGAFRTSGIGEHSKAAHLTSRDRLQHAHRVCKAAGWHAEGVCR